MQRSDFFGRKVMWAAFVMAVFGWGVGFYGPPVFLHAVIERTGWPLSLVSAAVTLHFLAGTLIVANLPRLHARFGIARVIFGGSLMLAVGIGGWAIAEKPWQLMLAALSSGMGWVTLGAAAVNALIAPWFITTRPAALGMVYNGASLGGVLFSPLWVASIATLGFGGAVLTVGLLMVVVIGVLAWRVFVHSPESLGQYPDGGRVPAAAAPSTALPLHLPGRALWRNRQFITLAMGVSLGLFAQIGLITHLFSLLVPRLGEQWAGIAMSIATLAAVGGRILVGRHLKPGIDRRKVACCAYAVQVLGSLVLLASGGQPALLWLGVVLFGSGIGNATSLPPLIAQLEFADVQRAVALIVAISQACYAFGPALFGLLRDASGGVALLTAAAVIQGLAILSLALGRCAENNARSTTPAITAASPPDRPADASDRRP